MTLFRAVPGRRLHDEKESRRGEPGRTWRGHNLLGAGAMAAALAVKAYLEEHPEAGSVVLFGCPSEEKGDGKAIMAREGIFDGVDAAFTWHPGDKNEIWSESTLRMSASSLTSKV